MSTAIADIPAGLTGAQLIQTINDRLRTVQTALAQPPPAAAPTTTASTVTAPAVTTPAPAPPAAAPATPTQLILSVPGTLAIESDAAALVQLQSTMNFTTAVLLLKQAPVGAALTIQAVAGTTTLGTMSVPDGATSSSASVTWTVPAGKVLMFNITGVGLTFPGSDLTIQLQS